jgi:hypothetical protein
MSQNPWLQYVKLYQNKHPELSYKEVLQEAAVSYKKLKKYYGGEWTNKVEPDFIRALPCFTRAKDKGAALLANQDPFTFVISSSSSTVAAKVGQAKLLATWEISYYDKEKKFKSVLCVHTEGGFTTDQQIIYFDTIGNFISEAMKNFQFKAYGTNYTREQKRQVEIVHNNSGILNFLRRIGKSVSDCEYEEGWEQVKDETIPPYQKRCIKKVKTYPISAGDVGDGSIYDEEGTNVYEKIIDDKGNSIKQNGYYIPTYIPGKGFSRSFKEKYRLEGNPIEWPFPKVIENDFDLDNVDGDVSAFP